MKADGSFLGYKQKPVPGSTPEPLNNFKVERKSSVGEGGLGGLGKGGGEGSGRERKKRGCYVGGEGICWLHDRRTREKEELYIMNRGRRVLEYAGYMLIVFVTAGVNILANDKIKKNAFIIR